MIPHFPPFVKGKKRKARPRKGVHFVNRSDIRTLRTEPLPFWSREDPLPWHNRKRHFPAKAAPWHKQLPADGSLRPSKSPQRIPAFRIRRVRRTPRECDRLSGVGVGSLVECSVQLQSGCRNHPPTIFQRPSFTRCWISANIAGSVCSTH